jgi:hypothetical protein
MIAFGPAEPALQKELEPSERLIWSGQPRQGLAFRQGDLFLVPFSVLWGGIAFYSAYTAAFVKNAPLFSMIWGIPFVLIGVYLTVGRFFIDSYQRRWTFYGLTNRRALILSGVWTREVKSIDLRKLNEISLTERSDGSGNILFGSASPYSSLWYGTAWPGMSAKLTPAFQLIPKVRVVYDLIRRAQQQT